MKSSPIIACSLALLSCASLAQERIELEGTRIFGNRELPQVLYIVPWQEADEVEVTPPEFTSLIDKPLTTIDRMAFQRQVQYHQQLFIPPPAESLTTTNTSGDPDNQN